MGKGIIINLFIFLFSFSVLLNIETKTNNHSTLYSYIHPNTIIEITKFIHIQLRYINETENIYFHSSFSCTKYDSNENTRGGCLHYAQKHQKKDVSSRWDILVKLKK